MRLIIIPIILIVILNACYYDNEENLFPDLPGACDTTEVSYSLIVQPILEYNCFQCHSSLNAASFGGNINLEGHSNVTAQAETVLMSVKHDPSYSPMPKQSAKLSDCSISRIEAWINQGKRDN